MSASHCIGQRISYDGALCTVRYVGEVAGTSGTWLGVEWDDATRGKHDGSHKGVRYFTCLSKSPTTASMVRPTRPAEKPQSFIAALNDKYAPEIQEAGSNGSSGQQQNQQPSQQIIISGKVAEEMGFDKIRRKLAQVKELKIVILDGMRIGMATAQGEATVAETCPKIVQLDLSRNLLEGLKPVVDICSALPVLRRLSLNGNRFRDVLEDGSLNSCEVAFQDVTELQLEETLLSWQELCHFASKFGSLTALHVGANQLAQLPSINYGSLSATLTNLVLEHNDFTALSQLDSLCNLKNLRNLHLKGNNISTLAAPGSSAPIFPESIQFLDLSYNNIDSWSFVDQLPTNFPGLAALRIAHNPIYDKQESADAKASSSEESHMFTIARLAPLKSLNFTPITTADRTNAEMFYLSRIAKQLATVPESAEASIIALHPRYAELCEVYGAPDVIRRDEINPSFLEARLVNVDFHFGGGKQKKAARIPKSFDIYRVKAIAGKLFGIAPLRVALVWETGEWDPVGGFEEREGDSSDEEDGQDDDPDEMDGAQRRDDGKDGNAGRWVKREVKLSDGPRQLGYCVDGSDVTIRVESISTT